MTMQTIKGGVCIPNLVRGDAAAASTTTDSMTTTTGKEAFVMRIPKAGNIQKIGFNINGITTSSSLTMSIQTVDATTGAPTGTFYNGSTTTSFTPSTGWQEVTLGSVIAVTKDDEVAIVIAATGATVSLTINMLNSNVFAGGYPYCLEFAGTWSKRAHRPIVALIYDDTTVGEVLDSWPISSITTATFNSGSTPDERALKFTAQWPMRVAGIFAFVDGDGDFQVKLYDTDGTTVLGTVTTDKDVRGGTNEDTYVMRFATPITLVVNSTYRLSILPTSVTSMTMYEFVFPSAAAMSAAENGQNWSQSQRTDAGAWTDNATTRPVGIGIIVDQFDDGLSGSGETSLAFAG